MEKHAGDNSIPSAGTAEPVLSVRHLQLSFLQYERGLRRRETVPIRDLSLELRRGEILAVIGSSGSGKSLLAHAVLGILPYNARLQGEIRFQGEVLTDEVRKRVCGRKLFLIPQSVTYLDPLLTVEKQIRISLERSGYPESGREERIGELLSHYALDPEVRRYYPHQLSGGMARRVLLACAMAAEAEVIIADEPTPGLDERALQDVLEDFRELRDQGCSVLMITHDIRAALQIADRITVFYEGETVETALPSAFRDGGAGLEHPYSRKLAQAQQWTNRAGKQNPAEGKTEACRTAQEGLPEGKTGASRTSDCGTGQLRLRAEGIHFRYGRGGEVLSGVDFEVREGETVGLIAPSGAGKTTLARILAGWRRPDAGHVFIEQSVSEGTADGGGIPASWRPVMEISSPAKRNRRKPGWCPVQMILQHPEKAVDPLQKMRGLLEEAGHPPQELLDAAGIRDEWLDRWPGELSGGELQRFCLVRVLSEQTRFLICDEMTTMLDAVSRAQLWELLRHFAGEHRIGVVVISHDRALTDRLCSRVVDLREAGAGWQDQLAAQPEEDLRA